MLRALVTVLSLSFSLSVWRTPPTVGRVVLEWCAWPRKSHAQWRTSYRSWSQRANSGGRQYCYYACWLEFQRCVGKNLTRALYSLGGFFFFSLSSSKAIARACEIDRKMIPPSFQAFDVRLDGAGGGIRIWSSAKKRCGIGARSLLCVCVVSRESTRARSGLLGMASFDCTVSFRIDNTWVRNFFHFHPSNGLGIVASL